MFKYLTTLYLFISFIVCQTTSKSSLSLQKFKVELLDGASEPLLQQTLSYPSKIDKDFVINKGKFFRIQFQASLEENQEKLKLDQAVLLLEDSEGTVTYLPFVVKSGLNYKITIGGSGFPKFIKNRPGTFQLKLLVGKLGTNPIDYDLGQINFDLPNPKLEPEEDNIYQKLKPIEHQFRQADKHPNFIFPSIFTVAVATLWLPLLFTLNKLEVNLSKLGTETFKLPFVICLGSYVYLATQYWLGLTLFPTIFYFTLLSAITLVVTKVTFF